MGLPFQCIHTSRVCLCQYVLLFIISSTCMFFRESFGGFSTHPLRHLSVNTSELQPVRPLCSGNERSLRVFANRFLDKLAHAVSYLCSISHIIHILIDRDVCYFNWTANSLIMNKKPQQDSLTQESPGVCLHCQINLLIFENFGILNQTRPSIFSSSELPNLNSLLLVMNFDTVAHVNKYVVWCPLK